MKHSQSLRVIVALFSLVVIVFGGSVAKNEGGADKYHSPRTSAMDSLSNKPTTIYAKLIHRDLVVPSLLPMDDDDNGDGDYEDVGDVQAPAYPLERTGIFFVNISIGQPPQSQLLAMDTGSSMIVVLKFGCFGCGSIEVPLYKPSESSSYENSTCGSEYCAGISVYCDDYYKCIFPLTFGDGNEGEAVLTRDTFRFLTSDDGFVDVPKVAFGCLNNMTLNKKLEGTNGILGLGPKAISLATRFENFSYCIGSLNYRLSPHNILILGEKAVTDLRYKTPLEISAQYYVTLEAISVGDKRLDIMPEGLKAIMDTGSTMTYLTKDVNNYLVKEIKNALRGVLDLIRDKPTSICYDGMLKRDFNNFPLVRLHFAFGADLVLEPASLFEQHSTMVCLAVKETDTKKLGNVALIGMLAQQNYNIGYNILGRTLSITRMDCRDLINNVIMS